MENHQFEYPVPVVLGAGQAWRFGNNKLLADLSGRPLLWYVLNNIEQSGFDGTYVVVSIDLFEDLRRFFPDENFLINRESGEGLASSIRVAVKFLRDLGKGIFIVNGDQPFFNADLIRKLVSLYRNNPGRIACASYNGKPRNPAIFPTAFFNDLMGLRGDEGGRSVISRNISEVSLMELEDEMYLFDVDTISDMEIARKKFEDYLG